MATTAEKKSDMKTAAIGFAVGAALILTPTTVIKVIMDLRMKE